MVGEITAVFVPDRARTQLTIQIEPANAGILIDDELMQVSGASIELNVPHVREQRILVFKDSYYPQEHILIIEPDAPMARFGLRAKFPVAFDLLLHDFRYPALRATFILTNTFPELFLSADIKSSFGLNFLNARLEENVVVAADGFDELSVQFGTLFLPTYFPLRGYASAGLFIGSALLTPDEERTVQQGFFSPSFGATLTIGVELFAWSPLRFVLEYVPRLTVTPAGLTEFDLDRFQLGVRWQPEI